MKKTIYTIIIIELISIVIAFYFKSENIFNNSYPKISLVFIVLFIIMIVYLLKSERSDKK